MLAATLACGPGAFVSHRSAAALLGLLEHAPVVVDVISPGGTGRGIDGICRHHVPHPRSLEAGTCNGVPCTSPSRTIVDLAGILGEQSMRHVVERAAVLRVLDVRMIEGLLSARRRRGAPTLRAVLQPWHAIDSGKSTTDRTSATRRTTITPHLRSQLEARFLVLIRASDLPAPACNQRIRCGDGDAVIEVDFLWPQQRVVAETDGQQFHDDPVAFERDRKRDRELQSNGYRVVRFTHRQIEKEPDAVVSAIRRLLAATSAASAVDRSHI